MLDRDGGIVHIFKGSGKRIWVATTGYGLIYYDASSDHFLRAARADENIENESSIQNFTLGFTEDKNTITSLYADSTNVI